MNIFNFADYRDYVASRIKAMPSGGRGEYQRIARTLGMHTTAVSQVFSSRTKNLALEQVIPLCEHFALKELESDYFLALVQVERAGSKKLRDRFSSQAAQIKQRARQLSARVPQEFSLTEEMKATFYSAWFYSAIRLMTSVPGYQSVDALADRFHLSRQTVAEV